MVRDGLEAEGDGKDMVNRVVSSAFFIASELISSEESW